MGMEALDLPAPLAAALLESPFPLADVYKDFRDMETSHMDEIRECIESRAERLLSKYAKEHRDLDTVQEQSEQSEKKTSIKEQLAAKPIPGEQTAKPKDRGER